MSPWGMSPGLPRYLSVEVLHEHPSRGYIGHPSMAHSVLRSRNQVPGFRVRRGGNREQEAGRGLTHTCEAQGSCWGRPGVGWAGPESSAGRPA